MRGRIAIEQNKKAAILEDMCENTESRVERAMDADRLMDAASVCERVRQTIC